MRSTSVILDRSDLALVVVTGSILWVVIKYHPHLNLPPERGKESVFQFLNHAFNASHSLYVGVSDTRSFSTWQPLRSTSSSTA